MNLKSTKEQLNDVTKSSNVNINWCYIRITMIKKSEFYTKTIVGVDDKDHMNLP